jgi:predicted secreted hydrolase
MTGASSATDTYQAHITAEDFSLQLSLRTHAAGDAQRGFRLSARKDRQRSPPATTTASRSCRSAAASLRAGTIRSAASPGWIMNGRASIWIRSADGWDWIGLNMNDGGALMAFRIRDHQGRTFWAAGTCAMPRDTPAVSGLPSRSPSAARNAMALSRAPA